MNNNEFQRTENLPFEIDETKQRRKPKENNKKTSGTTVVVRILVSIVLSAFLVFTLAWTYAYTVVHGPSEAMKERFVAESSENGLTSWLPHLVLPSDEIDEILERRAD
ncbi:MAG: hypothetical protein J6S71_00145 [Clostridia bacterium]|nr:hypothetical protein [Clostridia bacterium]